jgi:hypothetical protein
VPRIFWGETTPRKLGSRAVHQLEVGRQRGGLLLFRVEHLLRELLLVQRLAGLPVDEVEVRRKTEALTFQVAVAAHEARAVGARIAHHALLRLEAGAVLLLEARRGR